MPIGKRLTQLTPKQRQLLTLVADGISTTEIGEQLGTTENKARRRISYIIEKLGANNRAHAVAIAIRTGLLAEPTDYLPEVISS